MSNFKYILSTFVILFIVSCAQEDAAVSGALDLSIKVLITMNS